MASSTGSVSFVSLSLIFPDARLYYQYVMDAFVLIPLAFLLAGSIAVILTIYLY